MPKDISDDKLSRKDMSYREPPPSAVHGNKLPVYRETFSNVPIILMLWQNYCRILQEVPQLLTVN